MLPHKAPAGKTLIYFPYWRFKGMLFACLPKGIQNRFMDLSYQAVNSRHFPISVGLRSQAMKMKFVTPDTQGLFLKPTLTSKKVMAIFNERFASDLPKPILHEAQIGETLSMIYSPFYAEDRIIDAILNTPASPEFPDKFDPAAHTASRPDWPIRFLPTLCPGCGWDLSGNKDSLVLLCKNCETVWKPESKGLKKLNVTHHPSKEENVIFLPFWRIKAETYGISLESYADLVRMANLPKVMQKGWENIGFRFWGPAFKVRPQFFLRVGKSVTLNQPTEKLVPGTPKGHRLHPVNLPLSESLESMKLILADVIRPKRTLTDILPGITIKAKAFLLVYLPFIEKHHEFIHPGMNLAINKNQLALAKNL